jgi:hypothetical protein
MVTLRKSALEGSSLCSSQFIEGLADGQAPGQPAKITPEIAAFLERKLLEDRTWNCSQLAQEIQTEFNADIKRDTIRVKLLELGYFWKRGRFLSKVLSCEQEQRNVRGDR